MGFEPFRAHQKRSHSVRLFSFNEHQSCTPTSVSGWRLGFEPLRLSNDQLSSLPPEIVSLANLQRLYLDYNQLKDSIPAALSGLSDLSGLFLDQNPDLTCWETQEALTWALALDFYYGPSQVCVSYSFLHPGNGIEND